MSHLSEAEIVELLEGDLPPSRARHAATCADCRTHADALAAVAALAREDVDVPEPSPLFWDHLSARISQAVQAEPAPSGWRRLFAAGGWRMAAAATALALAAGLTWQSLVTIDAPEVGTSDQAFVDAPAAPELDGFIDAWDVVEAAAVDLDWEDGQSIGIASRPGSAERLVADLTVAERSELARLIEVEMKRSGD